MNGRFDASAELSRDLRKWQRPALAVGVALSILCVIGAFFYPDDFFRSYLLGYLFWVGIALGCMAIVMVQYLTGGAWGVVTRRPLEAAMRTLPLLAVLFIPIAFGIPHLYAWAHPDLVKADDALRHRSSYMNTWFFLVRAAIYFAIWIGFAYLLDRWSAQEDEHGSFQKKLEKLSAPGLILYVFTVTFASVDWAQSIESHWYSTMWGFLFVGGQGLAAMAFAIIATALIARRKPMSELIKPSHFHDLGKLLLMFVMLWAYFAFSQLLIVWSGNLTGEIPWYVHRFATDWGWLGVALICLQFIVPFLLLLSRPLKRNAYALSGVVMLLIVMRFVDLLWIIMPGYYQNKTHISWFTFAAPLAIGGLWLSTFLWQLPKRPLLPLNAPNLEEALAHGD